MNLRDGSQPSIQLLPMFDVILPRLHPLTRSTPLPP